MSCFLFIPAPHPFSAVLLAARIKNKSNNSQHASTNNGLNTLYHLVYFIQQSCGSGTIIIPMWEMRQLRPKVTQLASDGAQGTACSPTREPCQPPFYNSAPFCL